MALLAATTLCAASSGYYTKVEKKAAMVDEVTSVEAITSTEKFYLQDANGNLLQTNAFSNYWDCGVLTPTATAAKDPSACGARFTLSAVGDKYLMQVFHVNGANFTFWGGDGYVNAQPDGNVIFALSGAAPKYGQDMQDGALWTMAYEAGQGFSFLNGGRAVYLSSDATAARPSATAAYWKAYKGMTIAWDSEELQTVKISILNTIKLNKNLADIQCAEGDDALAAALNEAIEALNELIDMQAAITTLDEAGQTYALAVLAKYNNKEYDTIEEVRAEFLNAVRVQGAGANMTPLVVNPSFEQGFTGWDNNGFALQTSNALPAKEGTTFAEKWVASSNTLPNADIKQTVTDLKSGIYEVTAVMQYLEQGNGDAAAKGMFIFANDAQTEVTEKGAPVSVKVKVTNGSLTLGAKIENGTGNWCAFDNFTLKYLGVPEPKVKNLSQTMFQSWTAAVSGTATAPAYCAYDVNVTSGMPYGDGNVYYLNYADLSKCTKLVITATEGTPRCLFNRDVNEGAVPDHLIDCGNNATQRAAYMTEDNGVFTIDIAKIVADYGYCHLHSIKGANWQNVTVTSMKIYAEEEEDFPTEMFPAMSITFDAATNIVTFSPAFDNIYYYASLGSVAALEGIDPDTFSAEMLSDYTSLDEMLADETLQKGKQTIDLTDLLPYYGYGEWLAFANFVDANLVLSQTAKQSFNVEEPKIPETDLVKEMFYSWDGFGADAKPIDHVGCAFDLNVSTGLPYGNGSVYYLNYADLSGCEKLVITVSEGAPRCCFNREIGAAGKESEGTVVVETPRDAKYQTVEDNVYTIDIAQIVADYGYAHLNCIKGANWQNVTVTSMVLVAESEDKFPTAISNIAVKSNTEILDILGRKVTEMKPGQIYLVNGKKIVK